MSDRLLSIPTWPFLLALISGAVACQDKDVMPPPETSTEPKIPKEESVPEICAEDILGPRLLRRLTKKEFERNVVDAFALSSSDWSLSTLPPDGAAGNGLNNNADKLQADRGYAEKLLKNAYILC